MFTKDSKSYTGDVVNIAQGVGDPFYIMVYCIQIYSCAEMCSSCFVLKSIIVTKYNKGMKYMMVSVNVTVSNVTWLSLFILHGTVCFRIN